MTRSELREHVFKMLFQIEFNDKTCLLYTSDAADD